MRTTKKLWTILLVTTMYFCFNACSKDDDNSNEKQHQTIDGYGFIDLGLSVKWATSNLNGYYQYGNTSANYFISENYLPTTDIGGTSKDPAYTNMSNKWRLPSRIEMQELINKCTWLLVTEKGNRYFRVTGPSGKSITLPCSGAYPLGNGNSSVLYQDYQCWLMTSTLDNSGNPRPYILKASYINEDTQPTVTITTNEAYRISGIPVRGVSTAESDQMIAKNYLLGAWYHEESNGETYPNDLEDYYYEIWNFKPNGTLVEYILSTTAAYRIVDGVSIFEDAHYISSTIEEPYTFDVSKNKLSIVDRKEGLFTSDVVYYKDKDMIDIIGPADWGWTRHKKRYNGPLPPPEGKLFQDK